MKEFTLGNIKFIFNNYLNIVKKDIKKIIFDIEQEIIINELIIIRGFIFTSFKDSYILNFAEKYGINLVYGNEENNFNLEILYFSKQNILDYENILIDNKNIGINIKNNDINLSFINNLYSNIGTFEYQTDYIYNNLFSLYKKYGYSNNNFIKAWNFIPYILKNYNSFNIIRNKYFDNNKLSSDYPAGTGIDCRLEGNNKHLSSYLFLKSNNKDIYIKTITSSIQCEAESYGPRFSRAKLIKSKLDKNNIAIISGTAAVDNEGNSIFINDIEKNIEYTFSSIYDLLKQMDMNFDNIVSSFVYIKNKEFYNVFLESYKMNNYNFPYIYNFCDICRDDFLFEIECIAVKKY